MDSATGSLVLPAIQTLFTGAVLLYVRWTREDIQKAVNSIEGVSKEVDEVKGVVAVNTGRISHLEQHGKYTEDAFGARLMDIGFKASEMRTDVERLDAWREEYTKDQERRHEGLHKTDGELSAQIKEAQRTIDRCPSCQKRAAHDEGGRG